MDDAREAGMREMSAKFREMGGEVYVRAQTVAGGQRGPLTDKKP